MAAAQIICRHVKHVVYLPNFRAVTASIRTFSSESDSSYKKVSRHETSSCSDTVWPDEHLGPLSAKDSRFLLPGNVGAGHRLSSNEKPIELPKSSEHTLPDVLTFKLPEERHVDTLVQFVLPEQSNTGVNIMDSKSLECAAHNCPRLIKRDFQDLFPDISIGDWPLTVVTLSQKTQNDMSGWTPAVDEEREALIGNFVKEAGEICKKLQAEGYWADFIDPTSGRPYKGGFTNATMFETDERYRHFGFEIDDIGCCKVIRHHLWGTRAFIGCLFTNALVHSPIIQHMLSSDSASSSAIGM